MNISGKFSKVSESDYHNGIVLVGFCGNVYPHDLTADNIDYIKTFYNMSGCKHEFFSEWPEKIKPAYPAAKKNFINGFMLFRKEETA